MKAHFVVVNTSGGRQGGPTKDMYNAILQNVKDGLKFYVICNSAVQSEEERSQHHVSIISFDHTKVEVLSKPKSWDIYELINCIEKLSLSNLSYHDSKSISNSALASLEVILKQVERFKKEKLSVDVRISLISTECILSSEKLDQILKGLSDRGAVMDYIYIATSNLFDVSSDFSLNVNTSLGNFALLLRNWPNYELVRVDGDKVSIQRYFMSAWMRVSAAQGLPALIALPTLPGLEEYNSIPCRLYPCISKSLQLGNTQLCGCHLQPANDIFGNKSYCSISRSLVAEEALVSGFKLGSSVLHPLQSWQPSRSQAMLKLTVLDKVKMESLDLGLLHGTPFKTGAAETNGYDDIAIVKWTSFCSLLRDQECALILKTNQDIATGTSMPLNQMHYYALIPGDASTVLIQGLACAEQLIPNRDRVESTPDIPAEVKLGMGKVFQAISSSEFYDPLQHQSGLVPAVLKVIKEKATAPAIPASNSPTNRFVLPPSSRQNSRANKIQRVDVQDLARVQGNQVPPKR